MQYYLVIGGPRSGSQTVAESLVDSLNQESGGTALLCPWGRYKNWKGKYSYDTATFQPRLVDALQDKPQVQYVVVHGPGLVFNSVFQNTDLTTLFPTSQRFFVKREPRETETQMAVERMKDVETYKFLRRSQDPRLDAFINNWNQMINSYHEKFDIVVQDYTFSNFANFITNQGVVTVSSENLPENSNIKIAIA